LKETLKHHLNGILDLFQPGTVIPVRAETLKARQRLLLYGKLESISLDSRTLL
jgi:hypothetical protein